MCRRGVAPLHFVRPSGTMPPTPGRKDGDAGRARPVFCLNASEKPEAYYLVDSRPMTRLGLEPRTY